MHSPRLRDTGKLFLSEPCSLEASQDTPLLRMSAVACRLKVLTTMLPSTDTDCEGGNKHRVNARQVALSHPALWSFSRLLRFRRKVCAEALQFRQLTPL